MNNRRLHAYTLLFIVSMIWGVAGPVIKFTLRDYPPTIFLTYRFAISSVVALITFLYIKPKIPKNPKRLLQILFYGFLTSTVSLGLLFIGFDNTSSLMATLISGVSPIMVAAAGVLLLHEHVTGREKVGITIASLGTVATVAAPLVFANVAGATTTAFVGNLFVFASLIVGVATAVLAKIILRDDSISPIELTHISFIIGFLTMVPFLLMRYPTNEIWSVIIHAPLSAHLGVWYMALCSGTLAYTLYHIAEKPIEIGESALFSYLLPVWGVPLSVFWLNERFTLTFVVGAIIMTTGVVIAEYKKARPHRKGLKKPPGRRRKR